jgi:prophage regulatory protein
MAIKLLSFPELKSEKGIDYHRDYIRRLVKKGAFPQPVQVGDARIGWIEEEVDGWLEAKVRGRIQGQIQ